MMLPTHVVAGMGLALPFALAMPEFGAAAVFGGIFGGLFPDFDMYVGHRRTLHYPVYFPVLAAVVVPATALWTTPETVAASFFALGATLHCSMDVFGGGLELRPWKGTSDRGVYDHYRDRWIEPRRLVRYDGAPEDLLACAVLAVPTLLTLEGVFWWTALSSLTVAVVYTAVRRTLPAVAEVVVDGPVVSRLPDGMVRRVPARYRDGQTVTAETEDVPAVVAVDDR